MRFPGAPLVVLLAACASAPERAAPAPSVRTAEEEAARLLVGRFDSAVQASADPAYRAIQLTVCRVNAPELGKDVFYLESAQLDELHKPFRQRLYLLEPRVPVASLSVIRVLELKAPDRSIGLCARGDVQNFGPADVDEKPGCSMQLTWTGKVLTGGTSGTACASAQRGAVYTTSEMQLDAVQLRAWDRGFDTAGKQVWGPEKGPYVFQRRTPP